MATEVWWADYSAAKRTSAQLKAHGYAGVIRYIDAPDRLRTKHTNKAEWDELGRGGLDRMLVFEHNTDDPLGGYARGRAYALRAKAGADYLDYAGPIFFCADRWFATPGHVTITPAMFRAYLDGAASVLGRARIGAYGFADAMDAAVGHAAFFWQAGSRSVVRDHVHAWQDNNHQPVVYGVQTDRNLIIKPMTGGGGAAGGGDTVSKADVEAGLVDYFERKRFEPSQPGDQPDMNLWGSIRHTHGYSLMTLQAVNRLTKLVAAQGNVSAEDIAEALRPLLAADLLPTLREVTAEALGDDNDELADQISTDVIEKMAAKLGQEGT